MKHFEYITLLSNCVPRHGLLSGAQIPFGPEEQHQLLHPPPLARRGTSDAGGGGGGDGGADKGVIIPRDSVATRLSQ